MKNKNIYLLSLGIILTLIFIFSFDNIKIYYFLNRGNKNYYEKKYEVAKKYYEKAFKIKESKIIKDNLIKNDYESKKYSEVLKRKGDNDFLNGNSIVKLSESKKDKDKMRESLEYYKKEMIKNNDINIKKNYEIVLENIKNNQSKQKDQNKENNQKNQNKQDKQNNHDKQNKEDKQNKQQNSKENEQKDKDSSKQSKDKQKDKSKQKENNKQDKNKQNKSDKGQNSKENERSKEEVKAVLKRLEGSEKQAFKNNEKLINVGVSKEDQNRW
ncbi:hypothetical protein [Fusobacterium sp. IOR10]|uniref:hypothetical protein n=1 Tax=Fusobacterium sp. IOR10 TaxID=2665157 RepID=UPI0013D759FF|nr:hypothetical protein [Fusobacterium sp. IOR10]